MNRKERYHLHKIRTYAFDNYSSPTLSILIENHLEINENSSEENNQLNDILV